MQLIHVIQSVSLSVPVLPLLLSLHLLTISLHVSFWGILSESFPHKLLLPLFQFNIISEHPPILAAKSIKHSQFPKHLLYVHVYFHDVYVHNFHFMCNTVSLKYQKWQTEKLKHLCLKTATIKTITLMAQSSVM